MKKTKQLIIVLLSCMMLVGIAGCGSGKEKENKTTDKVEEEQKSQNVEEDIDVEVNTDLDEEVEQESGSIEEIFAKYNIIYNTQSRFVHDEEWIYYANTEPYGGTILNRIKVDGSYTQEITKLSEIGVNPECKLGIDDEWVYFVGTVSQGKKVGVIRVKKDGTEWEYLGHSEVANAFIYEDHIYYSDVNGIHKVSIESGEDNLVAYINNIRSIYCVMDDYIYYYKLVDRSRDKVYCRVKMDSSDEEVLCKVDDYNQDIVITDQYIYYYTNNDRSGYEDWEQSTGTVYRRTLDGSNEEILFTKSSGIISEIQVYDDVVYCSYIDYMSQESAMWGVRAEERKYYISAVDENGIEIARIDCADIGGMEGSYIDEYDGTLYYYNISIAYVDDEYMVLYVWIPMSQGGERYDYYLCDINGENAVKIEEYHEHP